MWILKGTTDYQLPLGETNLGRKKGEILINDNTLSRQHVTFKVNQSSNGFDLIVTDLTSKYGTFINNTKITEPTLVKHLDTIKLGLNTTFTAHYIPLFICLSQFHSEEKHSLTSIALQKCIQIVNNIDQANLLL